MLRCQMQLRSRRVGLRLQVSESTDDLLRSIRGTLDDMKAILTLTNHEKLESVKQVLLPEGSIKLQVYELCDGKSTSDIANAIKKSNDYVNSYLSILRREGLVKTVVKGGNQVHEQRF